MDDLNFKEEGNVRNCSNAETGQILFTTTSKGPQGKTLVNNYWAKDSLSDINSNVKSKTMNSTFTSGFSSTMRSTDFSAMKTNSSFKDTFSSSRGGKQTFARGYGKYKLKDTTPMYDFTGGDTPWVNKARVNNVILGQEQNFKVNHTIYDKEFDCARPIAHTKARKFCSMTRFIKSLEDNRIFQRWKMSAYRGTHR